MTDRDDRKSTVVPEEVLELLEERARVEGWLGKLQGLREDATPAVFAKIQSDYQDRLRDVNARLAGHRAELESSLERRRARVEELQRGRDEAAATLEEAQIRFRVGEYEEREWERRRGEGEGEIEALDAELRGEREALAALDKVLADLAEGHPAAAKPPRPNEKEAPSEESPSEEQENLVRAWGTGERGLVAAAEGAKPGKRRVGGEAETAQVPEEAPEEYLDELEFLESLSLDEADRFDAVSLMLDENEEEGEGSGQNRPDPA